MGILKRCAGPGCFLPSVVGKMFLGTSTKQPSIKEIPDFDIQLKLQAIADVETEDEFQNIADTFPERFGFGVTKFAISFMEKSEFVQQITQHFCFSMCSYIVHPPPLFLLREGRERDCTSNQIFKKR